MMNSFILPACAILDCLRKKGLHSQQAGDLGGDGCVLKKFGFKDSGYFVT